MYEKNRGSVGLTLNQCRKIKMAFGPYCYFTGEGGFRDDITINLEPICLGFHLNDESVSSEDIMEIAVAAISCVINRKDDEDIATPLTRFSKGLAQRPGLVALEPTQTAIDLFKKESHPLLARWFIALYHGAGKNWSSKVHLNLDHWHLEFYKNCFDLLGLATSD